MDTATVSATASQGTESNNISNIWVDVEGANLGVYPLGTTFPILEDGPTRFFFFAGIKENGISSTRIIYPFFLPDTITIDLVQTEIDTFNPVFEYVPATKFYNFDFENGNPFEGMGRTDSADLVFEGSACGLMSLDNINNTGVARLIDGLEDLPFGTPVFIEMDYRNNNAFVFGIEATDVNGTFYAFNKLAITPKEEWNKIYINVSPDITLLNNDNPIPIREYNFTIKATKADDIDRAEIYIDNFKVVY